MQKCGFNKVALQIYRNHTSAWVFSCKFAAYFQNIFYLELLGVADFGLCFLLYTIFKLSKDNFNKDLERVRGLLYGK